MTAALLGLALLLGAPGAAQLAPPPRTTAADAATLKAFERRVAEYVKLRRTAEGGGAKPKATASAADLAAERGRLVARMQAARANAKVGDLVDAATAALMRRRLADAMQGVEGAKIRASLQRAEPLPGLALRVNQPYPTPKPLQSMPPGLLLVLPTLPKDVDYCLVGRTLVLRDGETNLIVDLVPDAMPPN